MKHSGEAEMFICEGVLVSSRIVNLAYSGMLNSISWVSLQKIFIFYFCDVCVEFLEK